MTPHATLVMGVPAALPRSMVSASFSEFDTDRDGLLTYDEYKAMVQAKPTMIKPLSLSVTMAVPAQAS